MATFKQLLERRLAALAAIADAEQSTLEFYDGFTSFLGRCVRLGELDEQSADNVQRCLQIASDNAVRLLREQRQAITKDDAVIELSASESADFIEWRAQELERRRWQG